MTFDETPLTILAAAYRELNQKGDVKVSVNALLAAVQDKGINRQEVKDFLEKQRRGEGPRRPYSL